MDIKSMSKIILSLDPGIKNLGCCILEKNNSIKHYDFILNNYKYKILFWECIDILYDNIPDIKCHKKCKKPITYIYNNSFYCEKHISEYLSDGYLNLDSDKHNENEIPKKISELNCCDINSKTNKQCIRKAKYITSDFSEYFCKGHSKNYDVIELKNPVKKKVTDNSCFELCKKLYKILNNKLLIIDYNISHIIIENQSKTFRKGQGLSIKMNFIADCIFGYFTNIILQNNLNIKVEWVSPKFKLLLYNGPEIECKLKSKYSKTKYVGVQQCLYYLRDSEKWLSHINSFKKKDDICDALLNALYYVK